MIIFFSFPFPHVTYRPALSVISPLSAILYIITSNFFGIINLQVERCRIGDALFFVVGGDALASVGQLCLFYWRKPWQCRRHTTNRRNGMRPATSVVGGLFRAYTYFSTLTIPLNRKAKAKVLWRSNRLLAMHQTVAVLPIFPPKANGPAAQEEDSRRRRGGWTSHGF